MPAWAVVTRGACQASVERSRRLAPRDAWPGPARAKPRASARCGGYPPLMTLYRDPLAGLRSQIASKRGLLSAREHALPVLFRAMLPERLVRVLGQRLADDAESLEELSRMDATLDEVLAAHDEAAALIPKLRVCPEEVPDPARTGVVGPPWIIEEASQLEFRRLFTRRLAEIAPDAYLVRWDDCAYVSRFSLAGAPLFVSCRFAESAGTASPSRAFARTSVPRELPSIGLHEEGMLHAIGRALHLVRDHSTGDERFDARFRLDAEEASAAVIGGDVRAALLTLAPLAPQLFVRHGVAEVQWRCLGAADPASLLPDAAFAVLLGIRAAIERA